MRRKTELNVGAINLSLERYGMGKKSTVKNVPGTYFVIAFGRQGYAASDTLAVVALEDGHPGLSDAIELFPDDKVIV